MSKHRWGRMFTLIAMASMALGLLAACGGDSEAEDDATPDATPEMTATEAAGGAATVVTSELSEWAITVDPATVPAGEVTFDVTNVGAIPHELVIIRSDVAPDALPVEGGRVPESAVDLIGEVEEFPAGETKSGTFTLEAGSYVLICNIPAHYQQGMTIGFTVE